ncbi:MAG: hypothetical protein ACHQNT_08255 [Bacteroidia bacterium]
MYNIHINDEQLSVYSSKISDLILRASIEIESLSKELYSKNGGIKTGHIKYDDEALDFLIKKWSLDKKVVLISSVNCFQTNKTLMPFVKNEKRTGKTIETFSWNNSYQNIKHDRVNSLKFGSIKYLFDVLSVLYVLTLYYSDKIIPLEKDSIGISFSPNAGSDIFSVMVSRYIGFDQKGAYIENEDFEKSIYYINATEETKKVYIESGLKFNDKVHEFALQNSKLQEY